MLEDFFAQGVVASRLADAETVDGQPYRVLILEAREIDGLAIRWEPGKVPNVGVFGSVFGDQNI